MTEPGKDTQANRLIHETSPYLLQHAHNPVDWYPWGPEALARARSEDRPILLSIGYSACHWCHVMAHESFEDAETAALMNQLFVNIKVDREERPDLDAIYMDAVQTMTGHGGWPMTVFLTPEGRPFYGGTYFPPMPRQGMPAFRQVLMAVANAWNEKRGELQAAGERIAEALARGGTLEPSDTPLTVDLLDGAAHNLLRSHDRIRGGFGGAPKFPQPMALDFLLQVYRRTQDADTLKAVTLTLSQMAHGGIYDHLGGGFHRYSTDAHWRVPHFEKMLYDNAQLARTYLHAWQVTGNSEYRTVVEQTLDYVQREMTSAEGGFYSTQDADSEGEEGKFYLWTVDEVTALLGEQEARLFGAFYDITPAGNFREGGPGTNILHVTRDVDTAATALGVPPAQLRTVLERGCQVLFDARERRIRPGQDQKILAEWNGLMLHAFAEAGAVLNRPDYIEVAVKAGRFLLAKMATTGDGGGLRLVRTYKDGRSRLNGYLEDYAAVGLGMLGLYEATLDTEWLGTAASLAEVMLHLFHDDGAGAFFQTSREHERLVARRKDYIDSAVPSGNSLAAGLLLRLHKLQDRPVYAEHAGEIMHMLADALAEQPAAFGRLLCALDFALNPGYEIAIIGDHQTPDTQALLAEVRRRYLPNSVLALASPGGPNAMALVPFLAGRGEIGGKATAYVCQDYACKLPVTDRTALAAQLDAG